MLLLQPQGHAESALSQDERKVCKEVWALAIEALFLSVSNEFTTNVVQFFSELYKQLGVWRSYTKLIPGLSLLR